MSVIDEMNSLIKYPGGINELSKYGWQKELPSEINKINYNDGAGFLWNPENNEDRDIRYKGFIKDKDSMLIVHGDGHVLFVGCNCNDFDLEELETICEVAKQIREENKQV